jgi:hypothetical protein
MGDTKSLPQIQDEPTELSFVGSDNSLSRKLKSVKLESLSWGYSTGRCTDVAPPCI